jgi:hypothetical protein
MSLLFVQQHPGHHLERIYGFTAFQPIISRTDFIVSISAGKRYLSSCKWFCPVTVMLLKGEFTSIAGF